MDFYAVYDKLNFVISLIVAELVVCWRFPRRKYFWLRLVVYSAVCIALSFIPYEFVNGGNDGVIVIIVKQNFLFFVAAFIALACFEIDIWCVAYAAVIASCMQHIASYSFFAIGTLSNIGGVWSTLCCIAFYLVSDVLLYFIVTRRMSKNQMPYLDKKYQTFMLLVAIVAVTVLNTLCYYFFVPEQEFLMAYLSSIAAIIFCAIILALEMQQFSLKQKEKELQDVNLIQQKKSELDQAIQQSIDVINVKYHDLRHRLSDSAFNGEEERELREAMQTYGGAFKTGNEPLDIVLTEKAILCNKQNIRLTAVIDGTLFNEMKPGDIYALFGNILDNAIESVKALPEEYRTIKITQTRRAENAFCITVENFYGGEITFKDGLPVSPKDNNFHGFGVRSIKMITEKYGGEAYNRAENGVFTTKLVFVK